MSPRVRMQREAQPYSQPGLLLPRPLSTIQRQPVLGHFGTQIVQFFLRPHFLEPGQVRSQLPLQAMQYGFHLVIPRSRQQQASL